MKHTFYSDLELFAQVFEGMICKQSFSNAWDAAIFYQGGASALLCVYPAVAKDDCVSSVVSNRLHNLFDTLCSVFPVGDVVDALDISEDEND